MASDAMPWNDYRILQKLGAGAYSTVKLAKHRPTKTTVAVKETDLRGLPSDVQEILRREGKILDECDHPNIIRLFQIVNGLGIEFLVLEYADAGSLEDWLTRGTPLSDTQCADIFKQLCLGLEYLHKRGIAHRDVKPANMFMCRGNVVKLGDFGFASHTDDAELGKDCGSPQFAAPEIFFGCGDHDGRPADMWAAGVVLFRLVRGDYPYEATSTSALMQSLRPGSSNVFCRFSTFRMPEGERTPLRLIASLLEYKPKRRCTASGALLSPWLRRAPTHFAQVTDRVGRSDALGALLSAGLNLEESITQCVKRELRSCGAPLRSCCSSVLMEPSGRWTGHFRILRHNAMSNVLEMTTVQAELDGDAADEGKRHKRRPRSTACAVM